MATPNPLLVFLISLFSLFLLSFSTRLALPLTPLAKHAPPSSDPISTLSLLSAASLSRAHHLKRPKHHNSSSAFTKLPLNPRSYGGYSVSLSFGTPPQTSSFVMDTGSSLVWFPCTSRYLCSRCSFPNVDPTSIPTFLPKLSSSSSLLGCKNPKCQWLFGPDVTSTCPNASQPCPSYVIQYGSGTTAGLLLSESLDLPTSQIVPNFVVGCSFLSIRQPAGIAGFGRGPQSLPSQMLLSKFSYCLVSHKFDDSPDVSSDMVLHYNDDDHKSHEDNEISYTPFQKNPGAANTAYQEYYYLVLRKIIVGKKHVKIPYKYLVPGADDNGGTIVDSGSTFTYMEKPVFDLVSEAFATEMKNYTRAEDVESKTGLKPCFDISKEKGKVEFPEMTLQFKGGAKMTLPLNNYFALVTSDGVVCLTVVTDGGAVGPGVAGGPAVILGNYQQQNFYVEYDLKRDRFGFRKQNCQK